jgi:hypothetical protein
MNSHKIGKKIPGILTMYVYYDYPAMWKCPNKTSKLTEKSRNKGYFNRFMTGKPNHLLNSLSHPGPPIPKEISNTMC